MAVNDTLSEFEYVLPLLFQAILCICVCLWQSRLWISLEFSIWLLITPLSGWAGKGKRETKKVLPLLFIRKCYIIHTNTLNIKALFFFLTTSFKQKDSFSFSLIQTLIFFYVWVCLQIQNLVRKVLGFSIYFHICGTI